MNSKKTEFSGAITALVTPFLDGEVDFDAFERLVNRQIEAGIHGLVPMGTTGESATLTYSEHVAVIERCVEIVNGRVPVIAGAGSNSTQVGVEMACGAKRAGANALLVATGYYNKPSQAGIIAHFRAVHEASELPIILYNVPGRTACDMSIETIAELSKLPRIVGLKDATGDLARIPLQFLASDDEFVQLSGEDMTAVGFNAMGGRGCISVAANVAPALCAEMQNASLAGDYKKAREIQDRLAALSHALFADTSPGPTKYALSRLGLCSDELRLPLVEPRDAAKNLVDAALDGLGLTG